MVSTSGVCKCGPLGISVAKIGGGFKIGQIYLKKCKLSLRRILCQSKTVEIKRFYKMSSPSHIQTDSLINSVIQDNPEMEHKQIIGKIDQKYNKIAKENSWNNFMNLKEQNVIIKHILSTCQVKTINMWQSLIKKLPSNIFSFVRKSLIFCLPNKSNLFRWKLIENNLCSLCNNVETQLHVLSNCPSYLNRYTWRHDSILKTLLRKISKCKYNNIQIYADCVDFQYSCPSELFETKRPDIVLLFNNRVIVIELTVCFETNTEKSRIYKQTRYENLKQECKISSSKFEVPYFL